jgi:hypothetical protein
MSPGERDPVVDAREPGIDVSLLDESLRRTVEGRLLDPMDLQRFS